MKNRSPVPGILLLIAGIALLIFAALRFSQIGDQGDKQGQVTILPTVRNVAQVASTATPLAVLAPQPTETDQPSVPSFETIEPTIPATLPPIAALPPAPLVARPGQLSRPVRVVIPRINVNAPVVQMGWTIVEENGQSVAQWNVPKNEVGHALDSANPGERGNVVLSGHNNLFAAVFRKLYTLQPGDEITLYNADGVGYLYRVNQSYIVKELDASPEERLANARVLLPTTDARLTLTSCWPETSNTHRAIVIAALFGTAQP